MSYILFPPIQIQNSAILLAVTSLFCHSSSSLSWHKF